MWDLELGQEIILMTVIIGLIAWFMGRALCTSKSDQMRSINKQLKQNNTHLQKILQENEQDLYQINQKLKKNEKDFSEIEHQHNINYTALDNKYNINVTGFKNLKKEHKSILQELQKLQTCQINFEQLSKQHEEKSLEYIVIGDVLKSTKNDLRNSKATSKEFEHQSAYHKNENKQLSQDNSEQLEQIAVLEITLKNMKIDLESTNTKLSVKNNKITDFEFKTKHLDKSFQSEIKKKQSVKEKLKDTEDQLNNSINLTNKQKDSLDKCQRKCNELKHEVETYKILSTIG
jgi:DNA repair exonuclease SbcCD ATPase subunit